MEEEKSYRLLDHDTPLPIAEIERLYDGYWVFIVKAELDKYYGIISGIPVVVGTRSYDGASDRIYDKYRSEEYEPCIDTSFLPNRTLLALQAAEVTDERRMS